MTKRDISILTVGLSPAIQKIILFDHFETGEVNRARSYYTDAAGKCINVARVLTQGGVSAHCLTIAGRENLEELKTLCQRDNVALTTVESRGRVRTCSTIVDLENSICTELVVNEAEHIQKNEEEAFLVAYQELLPSVQHGVIISGSRLPGFSNQIIPSLIHLAKEQDLTVYADYKGEDLINTFQTPNIKADYVKINEEEFLSTFSETDLRSGLLNQSRKYESCFVITRGSRSTLVASKGQINEIPNLNVKAVNPIGCGDSMTAGLAQGIFEGLNLEDSVLKGRDYAAANLRSIHPGWILECE